MSVKENWKKVFGRKEPRFECHLREQRELAGLTQENLADHCQVAVETIELIENAKYEPSIVLAEHLSRYLNTTVESLFTAHPPDATLTVDGEERIRFQLDRVGLWCLYGVLAVSLIGANILFFFKYNDEAVIPLFVLWVITAITLLISTTRISGYWRFSRQRTRATLSKKSFWVRVVGTPIFFAAFMVLTIGSHDTWQKRILSFFFYAISWGGWMYWMEYRKVKPRKS